MAIGFTFIIILGAVVAVMVALSISQAKEDVAQIGAHSLTVSNAAARLEADVSGLSNHALLARVLPEDQVPLQRELWRQHLKSANRQLDAIEDQYLGNPAVVAEVRQTFAEFASVTRDIVQGRVPLTTGEANQSDKLRDELYEQVQAIFENSIEREGELEDEIGSDLNRLSLIVFTASLAGLVVALLLALGVFLSYRRQLGAIERDRKLMDENVMLMRLDGAGEITTISSALLGFLHRDEAKLLHRPFSAFVDTEDIEVANNALTHAKDAGSWSGEVHWGSPGDAGSQAEVRITANRTAEGRMLGYTCVFVDKTAERLSQTDPLTGIPNRRKFDRDIEGLTKRSRRHGLTLTLAHIDLDRLKTINDQYGHLTGDRALRLIADEMAVYFRRSDDHIYRTGGDEFVVVLIGDDHERALAQLEEFRAAVEAEKLTTPYGELRITTSIGAITVEPGGAGDDLDLYSAADANLLEAKRTRNTVHGSRLGARKGSGHPLASSRAGRGSVARDGSGEPQI